METALHQLLVLVTTAQIRGLSTYNDSEHLLSQLSYDDLVSIAHETGSALVKTEHPGRKSRLRIMYQLIADEHATRLTGRKIP